MQPYKNTIQYAYMDTKGRMCRHLHIAQMQGHFTRSEYKTCQECWWLCADIKVTIQKAMWSICCVLGFRTNVCRPNVERPYTLALLIMAATISVLGNVDSEHFSLECFRKLKAKSRVIEIRPGLY